MRPAQAQMERTAHKSQQDQCVIGWFQTTAGEMIPCIDGPQQFLTCPEETQKRYPANISVELEPDCPNHESVLTLTPNTNPNSILYRRQH